MERANRTIAEMFYGCVFLEHTDWNENIPIALFVMSIAEQATTTISPLELVYGGTAVTPMETTFSWPKEEPEKREVWKTGKFGDGE